jgi:hypothetical protein
LALVHHSDSVRAGCVPFCRSPGPQSHSPALLPQAPQPCPCFLIYQVTFDQSKCAPKSIVGCVNGTLQLLTRASETEFRAQCKKPRNRGASCPASKVVVTTQQ